MTVKWIADDAAIYISVGAGWEWSDAEVVFANIAEKLQTTSGTVAIIVHLQTAWSLPPGGLNTYAKRAAETIAADALQQIIFVAGDNASLQLFRGTSQLHPVPDVDYHFVNALDDAYDLLG